MRCQPSRAYRSEARVMTPTPLATAIVDAVAPSGRLLEPCAGDGAFVRAMRPYGEVATCEVEHGVDFFGWTERVDWIITNPPWSQFAKFLQHSLLVADEVVLLATVNHFYTRSRVEMVRRAGFGYRQLLFVPWPPRHLWHQTGFQLGAMRLSRGHRGAQVVQWLDVDYRTDEVVRRGGTSGQLDLLRDESAALLGESHDAACPDAEV